MTYFSKAMLIGLLTVSTVGKIIAQVPQGPTEQPYYHSTPEKTNDLVDTKLDVRFDYSKSWLYGKEWVTIKPHFYPTDSLKLDARYMDIEKIAIVRNGKVTPLQYRYDSIHLNIKLDRIYKRNERYTIYIAYTSKPNNVHDRPGFKMDGKGLWFVNPTGADRDKPTQIWTQGEAESSSCWFPTIDHPNQKTTDQISMTVPGKYTTLSNGLLISQKSNGDGTRTDTWKQSLPHAPYLFMMAIGDFKIYHDKWHNKNVDYYLEPDYYPYAKQIFGQTPEMIELFSQALGVDFPWEKYAQVVVRDYPLGAMENTSATLHGDYVQNRPWELIDDPNGSGGTTIAHELFHQWFGDYVTCESWSNETLNESFAVFGEKFWNEKKYGKDDGDSKRFDEMTAYLNNPTASGQALTPFVYTDKEGVNGANIYDKGGIVINMLRTYLGDSAFFKGLNLYLRTHAFSNAEVHDLRLAMEEVSGQDLNWFFNQWYYGAGHPVLDISYRWDAIQKKETVIIQQKQQGQLFQIPMAVDCYVSNQVIRKNIWLSQPIDTLIFDLPGQPDLVNVDAEKQLLCKKTDHKTIAEFAFQYQHAPRYLDRLEAMNTGDLDITTAALHDRYYGLRIKAIRSLKMDSAALAGRIAPALVTLAARDSNYLVRAAAIKALAKTNSTAYLDLYKSSLQSPSYTVKGAALNAINGVAPAEAFSLARSITADAKGQLGTAILNVYATSGSDSEWPIVIKGFNKGNGQVKFDLADGSMAAMLTRLSNKQYIADGINAIRDLAIRYKRNGMAPRLVASLQTISDARRKQGDEASAAAAEDAIKKINEGKSSKI
ncbi:MAG TPA: M1 family metallopeptidase [Puia sp.]|nr:M1 family metallopeptidase [Puia sp.]